MAHQSVKVKYLSPTQLSLYESDPLLWIGRYCAGLSREPQTPAMAIGSAFDARIKGHLRHVLGFGSDNWAELFESQVEPHVRSLVLEPSLRLFNFYSSCGALKDLLLDIGSSFVDFEASITRVFDVPLVERDFASNSMVTKLVSVPILGKPDMFFSVPCGSTVILDWKVNGYYSQASPAAGYVLIRGDNRRSGLPHPDVTCLNDPVCGYRYAVKASLNPMWYDQLHTYMLLKGLTYDQTILAIDQIAGTGGRCVAEHRNRASDCSVTLLERYARMWDTIHRDDFVTDDIIRTLQLPMGEKYDFNP